MHIYAIRGFNGEIRGLAMTQHDAHEGAKSMPMRTELLIELRDIPTDKAAVFELLNAALLGREYRLQGEVLAQWELTARGAMHRVEEEVACDDSYRSFYNA